MRMHMYRDEIRVNFDDEIDFARLRGEAGLDWDTIGGNLAFNP